MHFQFLSRNFTFHIAVIYASRSKKSSIITEQRCNIVYFFIIIYGKNPFIILASYILCVYNGEKWKKLFISRCFYSLILVTNKGDTSIQKYISFIESCIDGGVTCVQLREKSMNGGEQLAFGLALKHMLDRRNIPLIINDDARLCLELDTAGVHLGQSDGDVRKARAMLGSKKVIGLTVNSIEQIAVANLLPVDYIGVGAIFPTVSKPDVESIWGINGLKRASAASAHPIVAIGGINENNASSVMRAGANGIAAIGAFHNADNPYSVARKLADIVKRKNL